MTAALDWHLLDQPEHAGLQRLVRDLNHLYRDEPALHQLDCDPAGFAWIEGGDTEQQRPVVRAARRARQRCRDRLELHAGRAPRLSHRHAAAAACGASG